MSSIWIVREYESCSGCKRCEIACSMKHEDLWWPEASKIRVFMPFPGVDVPHLCVQCDDYPCVNACLVQAISIAESTAVIVDQEKCISCSRCIQACPGGIPTLHPKTHKANICDLCGGDPECVKVCEEAGYNALRLVCEKMSPNRKLYSRSPFDITKDLAVKFFGEKGQEVIK